MSTDAAHAIQQFLEALGHSAVTNPELKQTPQRVAEAWQQDLLAGYRMDPVEILSERCASGSSGMVLVKDLSAVVVCPHHLLPAHGKAHVAYTPGSACVGLGALARLVDCYGRRLALQEDVGKQIADALVEHLGARAAACTIDLAPTCMIVRGERQANARSITTAMAGAADEAFQSAFFRQASGDVS